MNKKNLATILAVGSGVVIGAIVKTLLDNKSLKVNIPSEDKKKDDFCSIFENTYTPNHNSMTDGMKLSKPCQCGLAPCPYTVPPIMPMTSNSETSNHCKCGLAPCPMDMTSMSVPMFGGDNIFEDSINSSNNVDLFDDDILGKSTEEECSSDFDEYVADDDILGKSTEEECSSDFDEYVADEDLSDFDEYDESFPSKFTSEAEFREYCGCSSNGAIEYIIGVSDQYVLEELKEYSLTDLGILYLRLYLGNEKELYLENNCPLSELLNLFQLS